MEFYSVEQYDHDDYARHFGYFQHKENAMTAALKAVANCQDDIMLMRNHCIDSGIDYDNYKDDMVRVVDSSMREDILTIWRGNYQEVLVRKTSTED